MKFFHHVVLTLLMINLLSGCGILDYYFLPPPEDTAQELYENAVDAMRDKDYQQAVGYYTKLKDNFPFSPYTIEAELSLGDAYFLDERYPEAAENYKEFESLHPRHEAMPYVLYQVGISNIKSFISIDRPTTAIQEALDYLGRLQESFPDSEYALKAAKEKQHARKIMAEHELYLGDVFWNMQRYGPAWKRYTYIVKHFPDVPDIYDHAKEKALAAYYKYREQQSSTAREEIQGTWKNLFKWM